MCVPVLDLPTTVHRTYLISGSIIDLYYTQLIGDATNLPVIKASAAFPNGSFGLIDSNPYQSGGLLAWKSTNTFFRQIRNFIFDTTSIPSYIRAVAIHWPSSQATSITNCVFRLSTEPGNNHIGIFIEEGSGGLLNDLYFYGGAPAVVFGNQQYTARNLWFFNAKVAIDMKWNWGWTYKNIHLKDCEVGMQMDDLQASIGSVTLLDSTFDNVGTAIVTIRNTTTNRGTNGTLAMENVQFKDVQQVIVGPDGPILGYEAARQGSNDLFIMVSKITCTHEQSM
jgi:glucan 1,3-beta-glucosidase